MSDEQIISAAMKSLARRRWERATAAERAAQGRAMMLGRRRKARKARRKAAKAVAK